MINQSRANPSRRAVQRRFPPGTLLVNDQGLIWATIIGWAPVAATVKPLSGTIINAATWEVLVLEHCGRLSRHPWLYVNSKMHNIDEWEEWLTRP